MRRTDLDLVIAGLLGAGGVTDAALAMHVTGGGPLGSAAEIMMVHAAAIVGLVALRRGDRFAPNIVGKIALAMGLAAAVFGADVTLVTFTGSRLFPYAAPIGGSVLIATWLALALLVVAGRMVRPPTP